MHKPGIVKFSGKSGARYEFLVYPLETVFAAGLGGVYVITRRKLGRSARGFVHRRICTGQSDDLSQPLTDDAQSLSARRANCICVHAEKDKDARGKIEQDLLRQPEAPAA